MHYQIEFDLTRKKGELSEGSKMANEYYAIQRNKLRKEKRVLVAEIDNGGDKDQLLAKIQHLNDLIESYKPLKKAWERGD